MTTGVVSCVVLVNKLWDQRVTTGLDLVSYGTTGDRDNTFTDKYEIKT